MPTNFWAKQKSRKPSRDSKYKRKTSCHDIEGFSWKTINTSSSDNSITNEELSQSCPKAPSTSIFRPYTEVRNRNHVSFKSYIEKDIDNRTNSFENCESDKSNSNEEENSLSSELVCHQELPLTPATNINSTETNIIQLKGLPPPLPSLNSSKKDVKVPLSVHLRENAQSSIYPSSLDKCQNGYSYSHEDLDQSRTNQLENEREYDDTIEYSDENHLTEHFVKCKEVSEKSNIISLKGLPPPPPKPPRIFLDGKSNSNVVTLENVVATNYE